MVPWHGIDKGVILAAGDGDRLGILTRSCPKVLLPADGREPLIAYPIRALAAAGIRDIAIVTGYLGSSVRRSLGSGSHFGVRLSYIDNPDYLGGNALSVQHARHWTQGTRVAVCMGDHTIEEDFVTRLDNLPDGEMLCVDHTPGPHHDISEATKVRLDDEGCIEAIGKRLPQWDGLDTGVFVIGSAFFAALDSLVRRRGTGVEMSDVVRWLVNHGHRFHTCDVSGGHWTDIDTEEDLVNAGM